MSSHKCGERTSGCELLYLAPAQRDLLRLRGFLIANGVSGVRAGEIIRELTVKLRNLKESPYLGFPIGGKYGLATPYRGMVCGKYIAIYEVIKAENPYLDADKEPVQQDPVRVEIRRIYHGREDYLSYLLADTG